VNSVDPSAQRASSRFWEIDSASYHQTALALLKIGRFAESPQNPNVPQTVRTPGYPAFLAAIYFIFGESPPIVIIAQIFVAAGTIWLTYLIAYKLWGQSVAISSMLLLALDNASFVHAQKLLTENLCTFMLVCTLFAGLHLLMSQQFERKWAALLGMSLAITTLIRPINYYLILPILIGTLIYSNVVGWKWKEIAQALTLIALPSILFVGGWQVRNYVTTGSTEYSHIQGINLLYYRAADIIAMRDGISMEEAIEQINASLPNTEGMSTAQKAELYTSEGSAIIRHHPLLLIRSMGRGLAKMMLIPGVDGLLKHLGLPLAPEGGPVGDLGRLSIGDYLIKWVGTYQLHFFVCVLTIIYLAALYLGAGYGIWFAFRYEKTFLLSHLFIVGILLYYLVISAGPEAYARFRVAIIPLLAIYAGKGLSTFAWKRIRSDSYPSKHVIIG